MGVIDIIFNLWCLLIALLIIYLLFLKPLIFLNLWLFKFLNLLLLSKNADFRHYLLLWLLFIYEIYGWGIELTTFFTLWTTFILIEEWTKPWYLFLKFRLLLHLSLLLLDNLHRCFQLFSYNSSNQHVMTSAFSLFLISSSSYSLA